jgi:thiamine biosynthesis lipoprotein
MQASKLPIVISLLFLTNHVFGQIEFDAEKAFRISMENQRPVLLVFAGSDWCAPCIKFEKKVLSDSEFLAFAKENLIILKADFPQRKKLSEAEQKQNEILAEQYNPKGMFPHIVLLRPDKSILETPPFNNQTSAEFISQIKNLLLQ